MPPDNKNIVGNIPKRPKGFQKGWKGGPGRPKKEICIPDILRHLGDQPVPEFQLARLRAKYGPQHNPKNQREAILLAATIEAYNGDAVAREWIANRTEGKVTESVKMEVVDVTPENVDLSSTKDLVRVAMSLVVAERPKRRIIRK